MSDRAWFLPITCLIALATALLVELYLRGIPGVFEGAPSLGTITSGLCLAYVASCIFYFVTVYLRDRKAKALVEPYLSSNLCLICMSSDLLLYDIERAAKLKFRTTRPEVGELYDTISRTPSHHAYPPAVGQNDNNSPTLTERILYLRTEVRHTVDKLLSIVTYLDSETIGLLTELKDSVLFELTNEEKGHRKNHPASMAQYLEEFFKTVASLNYHARMTIPRFPSTPVQK